MSDENFSLKIEQRATRDGADFGITSVESGQMTQTQMVIAQHVTLLATQRVLMTLGVAAAAKKDPEFIARYNAAMTMFGFPPITLPAADAAPVATQV